MSQRHQINPCLVESNHIRGTRTSMDYLVLYKPLLVSVCSELFQIVRQFCISNPTVYKHSTRSDVYLCKRSLHHHVLYVCSALRCCGCIQVVCTLVDISTTSVQTYCVLKNVCTYVLCTYVHARHFVAFQLKIIMLLMTRN